MWGKIQDGIVCVRNSEKKLFLRQAFDQLVTETCIPQYWYQTRNSVEENYTIDAKDLTMFTSVPKGDIYQQLMVSLKNPGQKRKVSA